MGWFWADAPRREPAAVQVLASSTETKPTCPVKHDSSQTIPLPPLPPASQCPVKHASTHDSSASTVSRLNPLNYMPRLSQAPAAGQARALPTDREASTIPRGRAEPGESATWEYPSPQQMYNAMLRKGSVREGDIDAVESMVAVHNFLNEGAWREIEAWEERFAGGLRRGWEGCLRGEGGWDAWAEEERRRGRALGVEPKLARFMGRPGDRTPKAKMLEVLGWAFPNSFSSDPPFDRHDWFVLRKTPSGEVKEVRYVIDYYSAPPEPTGEPVFYLDVRPALDGPTAAVERLMRWGGDVWYRASGGELRE